MIPASLRRLRRCCVLLRPAPAPGSIGEVSSQARRRRRAVATRADPARRGGDPARLPAARRAAATAPACSSLVLPVAPLARRPGRAAGRRTAASRRAGTPGCPRPVPSGSAGRAGRRPRRGPRPPGSARWLELNFLPSGSELLHRHRQPGPVRREPQPAHAAGSVTYSWRSSNGVTYSASAAAAVASPRWSGQRLGDHAGADGGVGGLVDQDEAAGRAGCGGTGRRTAAASCAA